MRKQELWESGVVTFTNYHLVGDLNCIALQGAGIISFYLLLDIASNFPSELPRFASSKYRNRFNGSCSRSRVVLVLLWRSGGLFCMLLKIFSDDNPNDHHYVDFTYLPRIFSPFNNFMRLAGEFEKKMQSFNFKWKFTENEKHILKNPYVYETSYF